MCVYSLARDIPNIKIIIIYIIHSDGVVSSIYLYLFVTIFLNARNRWRRGGGVGGGGRVNNNITL